ncbi:MAG: hypothetical protein GY711_17215 [bacterium]|nr:hypothetical protein [bacterium]
MATGTVVDGKIVVPGESLREGIQVTVLVPEPSGERSFELGPKAEAALLESIREADAGELINGDEVLRELGCRV